MASLWSDIRRDIAFRQALLQPQGGPLGWVRASLLSRGTAALAVHRASRLVDDAGRQGRLWARPAGWMTALAGRLILVTAKIQVANSTCIAPGVCLPDEGHLMLGATEVGPGTIIQTRVTIGMGLPDGGRPRIGARVVIGSDCVIFGAVVIGDHATVLPGSVVSRDVPPHTTVGGNPSRPIAVRSPAEGDGRLPIGPRTLPE